MADIKGKDPKPNPASDIKSGPVKPPVLDLTARETKTETPKTDPAKPEPVKPDALKSGPLPTSATKPDPIKSSSSVPPTPPQSPERPARPTPAAEPGFPIGATLAGAILGLAGAYGLAFAGLWPSTPAATAAADPRVAQFATAIPELETVTQTTQSELAALNQRIATLESAEPTATAATPAAANDMSGVEAQIAELTSRLDALPAAPAPTGDVDALSTDLAGVTTRLDELGARLGTAEASLRTLDTTVTETSAALASQPADIGAVLQLPLILSGFETAFATGRPYEAELAALRAASPDAAIPTAIANAAPTGLTRPDIIASRFDAVLPAIIAGRPATTGAQWQDGALDWFASAIALRPTGEMEGDSPEAVTSRLEGAIARRDFATAKTLFDALPQPMQTAAGDVPALVASQAEAAQFLDGLRAQALSGEAAQ